MKKPKIVRTRKIYRIRHMKYMLALSKRARRIAGEGVGMVDFHVDNYKTLLQLVQDSSE